MLAWMLMQETLLRAKLQRWGQKLIARVMRGLVLRLCVMLLENVDVIQNLFFPKFNLEDKVHSLEGSIVRSQDRPVI